VQRGERLQNSWRLDFLDGPEISETLTIVVAEQGDKGYQLCFAGFVLHV